VPDLPNPERSRAVLIGASRFKHLPALPSVRNNLTDLRTALTHPQYGIIAPGNCSIVAEPESPLAFMTGLRREIQRADDFLLVYYAGHGLKDEDGHELYLAVGHTDSRELDGSAVAYAWIRRALEAKFARASLLVLDCCYSGMAAGIMSDGGVSAWELRVRGSAVLTSSSRNETSRSPAGHRHTAFTGNMIRLLNHGSPNNGEPLTVNTLYRRMAVALTRQDFPKPQLALTDTSGESLVRRPDPPPPPVPLPPPVALPPPIALPPSVPPAAPPPVNKAVPDNHVEPTSSDKWIRLTGLRILWVLTGMFLTMFLGGLAGTVSGGRPDDISTLWIGLVLTGSFATPLWFMRARWLSLRRELAPPLITRFRAGRVVVLVGLVVSVLMIVMSLVRRGSDDAATTTGIGVMAGELAWLCGYLLLTRWRSRKVGRAAPSL
jgi:Caspase domain